MAGDSEQRLEEQGQPSGGEPFLIGVSGGTASGKVRPGGSGRAPGAAPGAGPGPGGRRHVRCGAGPVLGTPRRGGGLRAGTPILLPPPPLILLPPYPTAPPILLALLQPPAGSGAAARGVLPSPIPGSFIFFFGFYVILLLFFFFLKRRGARAGVGGELLTHGPAPPGSGGRAAGVPGGLLHPSRRAAGNPCSALCSAPGSSLSVPILEKIYFIFLFFFPYLRANPQLTHPPSAEILPALFFFFLFF